VFGQQGEQLPPPPALEASTLTHAQRRGLFARRSPLLRFQEDERLVALTRKGHQHAFDTLVERYQSRLLGFCRQMLGSTEDAEDVLQEVFVAAYNAMVADERPIAVRPWLYRIARNRCLNHLRKPTADGQDTMDTHPHMNGVTTHERVQNREEFRSLLTDVGHLPETQRSALLLREIDAMSYEEIAKAMDTTVPGVKSLLVRARIALAESSQSRQLTCDEVRIELAEAAEGLAKVGGPARRHIKGCDACKAFRTQLRSDTKALAAIFPAGPLLLLKGTLIAKLSGLFGGGGGGAAAGAGGGGRRRSRSGIWRGRRRDRSRRRDRHQGRRRHRDRRDPCGRGRRDPARHLRPRAQAGAQGAQAHRAPHAGRHPGHPTAAGPRDAAGRGRHHGADHRHTAGPERDGHRPARDFAARNDRRHRLQRSISGQAQEAQGPRPRQH
jgi:RNA polymerase sigma factor (sigma-70 family)